MRGPSKLRAVAVLIGIGALVVAGACSGDDAVPEPAAVPQDRIAQRADELGVPNPCELVTEDDAAELFGDDEEARRGDELDAAAAGVGCSWIDADADDVDEPSHLLQVQVFDGEEYYAESTYDRTEPLTGVGERAFVADVDALGVDVQFVEDGVTVGISYTIINVGVEDPRTEATDRRDEVVDLARRAARRL